MLNSNGSKFASTFMILVVAVFLAPGIAAGEEGTVSVTVHPGPYEIQKTVRGDEVHVKDFGRLLVPGKPDLPAKIFAVAIPPGAEVIKVTFVESAEVILPGAYQVPPSKLPGIPGQGGRDFEKWMKAKYEANYRATYGSDAPYPSARGEFLRKAGYRKYNLVDVRIAPFIYRPESGRLSYCPAVTINVTYDLPDEIPEYTVLHDYRPRCEAIARGFVINYDQAQCWYSNDSALDGNDPYHFVIITREFLTAAVQPLVDWETTKGKSVNVVTKEWIEANYTSGVDLEENIRDFLRDKYPSSAWGIEDVLIVGDFTDLPARTTYPDETGWYKPGQEVPVKTDFYYAELSLPDDQSWDLNGDGKYGHDIYDSVDFFNEVNVGRIPWSGYETVTSIIDKTVACEKNNDPEFNKSTLLLGAFTWPDTDNAVLMEYIVDSENHPWMSDWTMMRMYEEGYTTYSFDYDLKNDNVVSEWSSGKYAFVNWAGHGSAQTAHIFYSTKEAFVKKGDCPYLNDDYPAVIFAKSCDNNKPSSNALGTNMMKQGAVGFLGATEKSLAVHGWSDPGDGNGSSMDAFFSTGITSRDYTLGEAHQRALREMYERGLWTSYINYQRFEWGALLGNPDLELPPVTVLYMDFPEGLPGEFLPPGPATDVKVQIVEVIDRYLPGTGYLHYRFDPDDPYIAVPLAPLGGDLYTAQIPGTKPGDEPEFYFSAQAEGGGTVYSPVDAPNGVYSFDVCFVDLLMEDDFEGGPGDWTVENVEPPPMKGKWEHGDPNGYPSIPPYTQPEDDHTVNGTQCFVTGNASGFGAYLDNVNYGPTRLISPTLDLTGGDAVISFYFWFYYSSTSAFDSLEIHLSNNDGASWTKAVEFEHKPEWTLRSLRVSDFIEPSDEVIICFSASDFSQMAMDIVEAALDDVTVVFLNFNPSLWADTYSISVSTDSVVNFHLDAGEVNGGREYLLLGSLSGTDPGFTLPDGSVLPINWDDFTTLIANNLNTPMFYNFWGHLNDDGIALATYNTLGPIDPSLIGEVMSFAYYLNPAPCFTSNPINVVCDP